MDTHLPWLAIALGVIALGLALVGAAVFVRLRARTPSVTAEERAELAASPMTPLQRIAWAGLLVGVIQCLAIGAVFATKGGAAIYWEDDRMRTQVVGLFILGLVLSGVLSALARIKADERERAMLAWGPKVQSVAMLIAMAPGTVFLVVRFHGQG